MFPAFNFLQGGSGISVDYTGVFGDVAYRLLGFGGKYPDGTPTQENRDVSDSPNIDIAIAGTNFGGIKDAYQYSFSFGSEQNPPQKDIAYFIASIASGDVKADNIEKIPYLFKFYGEVVGAPLDRASYEFGFDGALFPQVTDRNTLSLNWDVALFNAKQDEASYKVNIYGAFFNIVPNDLYNIKAEISSFTLERGATRVKAALDEDKANITCTLYSMTMEAVSS